MRLIFNIGVGNIMDRADEKRGSRTSLSDENWG